MHLTKFSPSFASFPTKCLEKFFPALGVHLHSLATAMGKINIGHVCIADWWFSLWRWHQMYSGGVYASSDCSTSINHGVLIVGYGTHNTTDGDLPYWIIKNRYHGFARSFAVSDSSLATTPECGVVLRVPSHLGLCVCLYCSKVWRPWPRKFTLVCRYVFRIFSSSSYVKVIGSRSKSQEQNAWNLIPPPPVVRRGAVSLQMQWRQVHFRQDMML